MTTVNTETAADAFLNWVRHRERPTFFDAPSENHAAGWHSFFATNMGVFLRNAVIYQLGMVQHYQDRGIIPQTPIAVSTSFASNYILRLAPQEVDATAFGSSSNLPANVSIYGWLDAGGFLSDGISTYWLLVADGFDRLLWIAANGVAHDENQVKTQAQMPNATVMYLNPARNYANTDLSTVIGA